MIQIILLNIEDFYFHFWKKMLILFRKDQLAQSIKSFQKIFIGQAIIHQAIQIMLIVQLIFQHYKNQEKYLKIIFLIILDCSSTKIKHLLNTLEKTHLIFHCEPYGSASKRYRKSWRYFFATASLRNVLNNDLDNPIYNIKAYKGILLGKFCSFDFISFEKSFF